MSVSAVGRARLCEHVKLSIQKFADNLELAAGEWGSGHALQALLPEGPDYPDSSIQNVNTKVKKKNL